MEVIDSAVGKPKDGDPRACYAVLDAAGPVMVEFVRLSHDVVSGAAAIRASGVRYGPRNGSLRISIPQSNKSLDSRLGLTP